VTLVAGLDLALSTTIMNVCKDMDTLYNFFVSKSKAKEKGEEYKTTL
jgi:hypothetical protein